MSLPGYPGFRLGLPSRVIRSALASHGTELVHLASPVFLGAAGSTAARHLGLPPSRCTRPTSPPTPAPTAGTARVRRPRGGGCAASTTRPNGRWRRPPRSCAAAGARIRARVAVGPRGRPDAFRPGKRSAALRRELAPGGEVLAGYVGRLATEKRVDLLAAVAELPGVRLVVVGGGPAAAALRERMPVRGLPGGTTGRGTRADLRQPGRVRAQRAARDVRPDAAGGRGRGVPVVAPAAGGPLDLVDHGVTGYLVPPGNGPAIAAAVARLAADPGLRAESGRRRPAPGADPGLVRGR